jgi:hypothetical protein
MGSEKTIRLNRFLMKIYRLIYLDKSELLKENDYVDLVFIFPFREK